MNGIKISLAEVAECAERIRASNQRMFELLNQMRKEMNDTNVSWISEGGESVRLRFNQFANRFAVQKDLLDSYARFLDQTVASYDSLETTIANNASGMRA